VQTRPGTLTYMLESKTRKMYSHMPYSVGSYLPAQEGSDAATCYQSDFVTLSSVLLHEQPVVVLLLERVLVS
jgi:hypothetical protein